GELQKAYQQIVTSTSWRITAPLRSLRVRMGAPPPANVNVEGDLLGDEDEQDANADTGVALIPADLPKTMVASNLSEALRSNGVCQILDLDWTMKGLVPDAYLDQPVCRPGAGMGTVTSMHLGKD